MKFLWLGLVLLTAVACTGPQTTLATYAHCRTDLHPDAYIHTFTYAHSPQGNRLGAYVRPTDSDAPPEPAPTATPTPTLSPTPIEPYTDTSKRTATLTFPFHSHAHATVAHSHLYTSSHANPYPVPSAQVQPNAPNSPSRRSNSNIAQTGLEVLSPPAGYKLG